MSKVHRLGLLGVVCLAVCLCWYVSDSAAQPAPTAPLPAPTSICPAPAPPTAPQSIEDLVEALAKINAQEEELAKQKKAVKETLKKKLDDLGQKLKKVGFEENVAPAPCVTGG